eukprot:COSAG02_NODE_57832_length_279_cov_0.844444_1_plen_26_part_01
MQAMAVRPSSVLLVLVVLLLGPLPSW